MAIAVLALLAWYVLYTRQVVSQLRSAAATQGKMFSLTIQAQQDTNTTSGDLPADKFLKLTRLVTESGVPLVVTDNRGRVAASANVSEAELADSAHAREFIANLDRRNAPIVQKGLSTVHYGDSPIVRNLQIIPALQAAAIILLLAFGLYAVREHGRADREKVWAGMAREAAHQLGTPLSSIGGWLELLGDRATDTMSERAIAAMQQDLLRLDRVSHRFERIGRPPRNDSVDAAALAERLAAYFAARAPTLAKQVQITSDRPDHAVMVHGDSVLLEWVLEVLIKNAIDALGGRDGHVKVSAQPLPEGGARIRVADDGPGIPRELRKRIFDAGFSTKDAGWGIGLSLARRIVEENHGGKLLLVDTDHGAVFDVILRG
ncbi:MAG: HAMP domain-containing histidine kinase [Gemmatimonadota bacterium]|nr:HAMP domain-containing histidine kinase [Gemmatimonadota bacterium]